MNHASDLFVTRFEAIFKHIVQLLQRVILFKKYINYDKLRKMWYKLQIRDRQKPFYKLCRHTYVCSAQLLNILNQLKNYRY